jgi:ADP-heptose:LPS heptosyltransferase
LIFPLAHRRPTGPFAEPRPSMNGRYLLRSKRAARMIATMDAALSLVPVRKRAPDNRVRRILLANWGHLGDVVTTFGAISLLREQYPGIEIGMIVSNAAKFAIIESGLVDRIHVVDHWRINRTALTAKEKRQQFQRTRSIAIRDIRRLSYDAAIDFYSFFPPAHPLFYKAGIPVRIGYTSGGFGPLLTHPVPWADLETPVADQYRPLINALHSGTPLPPGALRPQRQRDALAALPVSVADAKPYLVLHPGAGATWKEWGIDRWRALIPAIHERWPAYRLVMTGAGETEIGAASELAEAFPDLVNLTGKVDWATFVTVIANAKLVICPDTATGHVAALFNVPVVSIFPGINVVEQWRPYTDKARVLVQPVACAPCNRFGCDTMSCIRSVMPADVLDAVQDLITDNAEALPEWNHNDD